MSRTRTGDPDNQLDLFLPYIADLNFRDQREIMERPFFSLAKSKRVKPIDYTSPDGKLWVHVSANPDYGMATIWDGDILIYCASVLADMARRGVNDVPRKLNIMPFDLLRSIGRPTTGRAYELLAQSLDRLVSTTIKTNIRAENRREATFSWLDGWTQLVDERTERSKGMTIELSNWFYEGVLMKGGVLAIDRAYFEISGGRERWLYKVARKHAGGAGEQGFAIALPTLFEKSGAEGEYRRFKFELIKLIQKNALPGYDLAMEPSKQGGEPLLRMIRRDENRAGDEAALLAGLLAGAEGGALAASPLTAQIAAGQAASAVKGAAAKSSGMKSAGVKPAAQNPAPKTKAANISSRKLPQTTGGQGRGAGSSGGRAFSGAGPSAGAGAFDGSTISGRSVTSGSSATSGAMGIGADGLPAQSTLVGLTSADLGSSAAQNAHARANHTRPASPVQQGLASLDNPDEGPLMDASAFIRRSIRQLGDASTRGFVADETAILLRQECPGWDLNVLHREFEAWVSASAERTPANWQKAFIGWVRRYHEKNRHLLRG